MSLEEWAARNDTMVVATNADGKMVAAGWFNVRPDATKEEKKDLKAFYRDCVGHQIQMLTKDDKEKFNAMEWVS